MVSCDWKHHFEQCKAIARETKHTKLEALALKLLILSKTIPYLSNVSASLCDIGWTGILGSGISSKDSL